jgi:hypothetical protein
VCLEKREHDSRKKKAQMGPFWEAA